MSTIEEQIKNYQAMLASDPASKAFAPLAELYRRSGKIAEAIALCQQGLSKNPDHTGGHLLLAQLYIDSQKWPAAEKLLLTLLHRLPNHLLAHQMLLALYQKNKRTDAARAIELRLQKLSAMAKKQAAPQLPTATMAKLYADQGHLDKALEIYRQLVAKQPELAKEIARLEHQMVTRKKIALLEGWLKQIQAKRTGVSA